MAFWLKGSIIFPDRIHQMGHASGHGSWLRWNACLRFVLTRREAVYAPDFPDDSGNAKVGPIPGIVSNT